MDPTLRQILEYLFNLEVQFQALRAERDELRRQAAKCRELHLDTVRADGG